MKKQRKLWVCDMARNKMKDSEARSFRIRKEILVRLDKYSEETMIPKTAVVEMALKLYLDKFDVVVFDSED